MRGVTVHLRGLGAPQAVLRAGSDDHLLWDLTREGLKFRLDLRRPHETVILQDVSDGREPAR
jgi:hypothetical protein